MIRIRCPQCEKSLVVKPELAGRVVACPGCQTRMRVPAATAIQPEPDNEPPAHDEEQPRRRREREDDERPRRRPEPVDDDGESPLEERPRRKRRRRRRQRESSAGELFGMSAFALGMIAAGVISLLAIGLAIAVPQLAFVPSMVGSALSLAGGIWVLVIAFQDDTTQGILCLCVPCYSLYYIVSNFEETKQAAAVWGLGVLVSMAGAAISGAAEQRALRAERPQPVYIAYSSPSAAKPPVA